VSASSYASASGRFKALTPTLLPREAWAPLLSARDLPEIEKLLEPTVYGPELVRAGTLYRGAPLLEAAINRVLVNRNQIVLRSAPYSGKPLIEAYLRRWDIANIGLILSAKANGRPLSETEAFLVSGRDLPAGLFAGTISIDDFRGILQQASMEGIATQLVKYGYGAALLPLLETYERTRDIFPLLHALDRQYYAALLDQSRFFQGDEWVIREFLRDEIDLRNVLLLLKGKRTDLPVDPVLDRFLDGGNLPRSRVADLYNVRDVPALVQQLEGSFPALPAALPAYQKQQSLVPFEVALTRARALRELKRFREFPLSICILFGFLLWAELERADLRQIAYGKLYAVDPEELRSSLVLAAL
jgi:V/A-type H+/Na+-transporting ATPase subunit C